MVRKNPGPPASAVTDEQLAEARSRAAAAAGRLAEAERADPAAPGWESEYAAALSAVRLADRRVAALESLRASQLERAGQRDAAVKSAQAALKSAGSSLAASRDRVALLAAAHLQALAELERQAAAHNDLLAATRAELAGRDLHARDEVADVDHGEGALPGAGVRIGGTDWTRVDAAAVTCSALWQVFAGHGPAHPLGAVGKYTYRAHETHARPDGLRLPVLDAVPAVPATPRVHRATVADILDPPPGEPPVNANPSGYEPGPARRSRVRSV
jgi:hypothetical protein